MKLRWGRVQENWPDNDGRYDWGANATYRGHVEALFERIKTAFPATMRREVIKGCKRRPGETVADFLARLTTVFRDNSGMTQPDDPQNNSPYEQQLKNCFMEGIGVHINRYIHKHCVGWEIGRRTTVKDYAIHAEKTLRVAGAKEQRAKTQLADKLQMEKLQALENANRGRGRGGPPQSRGRAQSRPSG